MRASVKKGLRWLAAQVDMRDAFVFGGLGCAVYGLAQWSVPAAWILAGATLFWLGVRPTGGR
jgi:hypothetical protein